MTDQEFEKENKGRRYLMLFGGGTSGSLEEKVEQAMRFGFKPHGSLVCPEPRFYIQPMVRDIEAGTTGQAK